MLEQLIKLLGKSIEEEAIKQLFTDWRAEYPKKVTCHVPTPNLKTKVEKDCIRLYFGMGGEGTNLEPIPTKWEGAFFLQLLRLEFTKKSRGGIPFNITHAMTAKEITAVMGKSEYEATPLPTTTWRKKYQERYELTVQDITQKDGVKNRIISLSFAAK